ncbi:uncharacterized protein LY89DRAFT_782644 [Mollisia scopiformis]|uniref:Uncharacterized protein n=1 Tax=Mollisia scopiformis TaxID=149040 RepID=A0A194X8D6_MOLSC|nr:uncharacterized protein LY89DRAFT_782644 [Mollisia scopiformis]KUJ16379.1 hypothetical protein LY89DRAFT_782644 [Mollisia scopiformis]
MSTPGGPMQPSHGPYLPTTAGLGGMPTKGLDVPITSVFLVLFVLGAVTHMTILQINLRRGHKFIMSGLLFGFCMARIMTCTMRLVWSTYLTNISVAIAAQIFVAAGVLILFIVNLIFTQRIIRATHPHLGWAKTFSWAFKIYYACIIGLLIALITCTVDSFYTLNKSSRRADRDVQLLGSTFFAVAAFLPIPLVLGSIIIPKKTRVEKFGSGRFRTKIYVLLFSSFILSLGAFFRAGTAYVPRPRNDPAWYDSKACFYLFNFTIEIIVVALYAVIRVDKRFHVPDKSHGPGDYSRTAPAQEAGEQEPEMEKRSSLADRVLSEEQVFDDDEETQVGSPAERQTDVEVGLTKPEPTQ